MRKLISVAKLSVTILLAFLYSSIQAQTWTSATPGNWSTGSNWSGGVVPALGATVTFDGTGNGNCNIDVPVNIDRLLINGYAGTITQGAGNPINLGTFNGGTGLTNLDGEFNQTTGTFVGGDENIVVSGPVQILGGNFTSTQDTLFAWQDYSVQIGANFVHNGGTVSWSTESASSNTINISGNHSLHNLHLYPTGNGNTAAVLALGTNIIVENDVARTIVDNSFVYRCNGGVLQIQGDCYPSTSGIRGDAISATIFEFIGNSTTNRQEIFGTLVSSYLPNVEITVPATDSLIISNTILVEGNWTYNSGRVAGAPGKVVFIRGKIITGSNVYPNSLDFEFRSFNNSTAAYTFPLGTVHTIQGTTSTGPAIGETDFFGDGELHIRGDFFIGDDRSASPPVGGDLDMYIDGTANQIMDGNTSRLSGLLPNLIIDKPSGILTIRDTISVGGDFTYIRGSYDNTTFNSAFAFHNDNLSIDAQGTFGDFVFNNVFIEDVKSYRTLNGRMRVGSPTAGALRMQLGIIDLNSNELIIQNPNPLALTRDSQGFIVSETVPASGYGTVQWNIDNSATGNYNIPFGRIITFASKTFDYIPFDFSITAAGTPTGTGSISVATYRTDWVPVPNNRPFPTGVTNINNPFSLDNYCKESDRFWVLGSANYSTQPTVTISAIYLDDETILPSNCIDEPQLQAHFYNTGTNAWGNAIGSVNTATNIVTIPGVNSFSPMTVYDPQVPDLAFEPSDTTVCVGDTITWSYLTPTTPSSFAWVLPGSTPLTALNIQDPIVIYNTPGTYDATLTADFSGNIVSTTQTAKVTVLSNPVATGAVTDVACNGESTGAIDVSVTGATSPTYNWNNTAVTQDISGIPAGGYTVIVTETGGCADTVSFTVNQPSALAIDSFFNDVVCAGGNDGAVWVDVTGGTGLYTYSWSNSASGVGVDSIFGLGGGTYCVTVEDANGCTIIACETVSEPLAPVAITATFADSVSCNAGNDGTATISVTGGTPNYTYSWSSGGTPSDSINTGLMAGTYTVTVSDANGCSITTTVTVGQPLALTSPITINTGIDCFGDATGSVTATAAGGNGGYTYAWSAGNNTSSATNTGLLATTYTVTVTDRKGCSVTDQITFTNPAQLIVTIDSVQNASCNGDSDGAIELGVSGGTGLYTYNWTPSGPNDSLNDNLAANLYNVTVSDANGCTTDTFATITEPTALSASTVSTTNVACFGVLDGTGTISATGGTGIYTYNWGAGVGNDPTAALNTGLGAGNYIPTVTDANGCSDTTLVTINAPTATLFVDTFSTDASCGGLCDGVAWVTVTGGTTPYTYTWSAGTPTATGDSIINLCAGSYTVTVADSNGCSEIRSMTVNEPPVLIVSIIDTQDVSCNGDSTGYAAASSTGGIGVRTYLWSNGDADTLAENIPTGGYSVIVTDINGCADTASVVISEPPVLNVNVILSTPVLCNGDSTGTAEAAATGGTPGYSFIWSTGQTGNQELSLAAGSFTVTVTDTLGCTDTASVVITEPVAVVATLLSFSNVTCNGDTNGTATISVTGGTGAYTYNWGGAGNNPNDSVVINLSAGTYIVTVTDFNFCSDTATVTILEPAPVVVIIVDSIDVLCNGDTNGRAAAIATGGTGVLTYLWSNADPDSLAENLGAGLYTVTATDVNGCTATASVTISEPALLTATITDSTDISCFGFADGSATVAALGGTPGYDYSWSAGTNPSTTTVTDLTAGVVIVTVTDTNNCTAVDSVTIVEPTQLTATIIDSSDVLCFGDPTGFGLVQATGGTPGYDYQWNVPDTDSLAENLTPGSYSVTVTDTNGCVAIDSFTVTSPAQLLAAIDSSSDVTCNGFFDGYASIITVGGSAPYTYFWFGTTMPADSFDTALPAGTFQIVVSDSNSCTDTLSVTIAQPAVLTVSVVDSQNVLCNGDTTGFAEALATGGTAPYNYLWSTTDADTLAEDLGAGTYTVTVTDDNGCIATASVTITEPAVLTAAIINSSDALCNGDSTGTAEVQAAGGTPGYSYAWSSFGGNTPLVNNLPAGTYTVTVTDTNGCVASDTVVIGEPALLVATLDTFNNVACNGDSTGTATVVAVGGTVALDYSYDWGAGNGLSPTAAANTGLPAGTYLVTVTDDNGCSDTASVVITEPSLLLVNIVDSLDVLCNGDTTGRTAATASGGTGPYAYAWSNGDADSLAQNVGAGAYTVTVTDANGCTTTVSVTINQPPVLIATVTDSTNITCFGFDDGTATAMGMGGTPPYTYLWSGGTDSTTASVIDLAAGTYTVTVTDSNGCTATDSVTIIEPSLLTATIIDSSDVLCFGDPTGFALVQAGGGTPGYTYDWTNGDTTALADSLTPGIYVVLVSDTNGCTATDTIAITSPPELIATVDTITDASCFGFADGEACISVLGGAPAYTFDWNGAGNTPTDSCNSGLAAGTYVVLVADSNGCTDTVSVVIAEPILLQVAVIDSQNVLCFGEANGYAIGEATGGTPGYSYVWSNGFQADSIGGLVANTYTVTVTDTNGCVAVDSVNIIEPPLLTATITDSTNISCFGLSDGSLTVTAAGGAGVYTYEWSLNPLIDSTIINLPAGTYTVTVTDTNGCVAIDSASIVEPPQLFSTITDSVDVLCFGDSTGSATVLATGGTPGYAYAWNDAANSTTPTVTGIPAGTFSVVVTDTTGCVDTAFVNIDQPTELIATIVDSVDIGCFGDSTGRVAVVATGGTTPYDYVWNFNAVIDSFINGVPAGTYVVQVTDSNFCSTTATIIITQPAQLVATVTDSADISCFGEIDGTATVAPTGGTAPYAFNWGAGLTPTAATNSGLAQGTYVVTVTDTNGCTAFDSVTILEPAELILNVVDSTDVLCFGESNGSAEALATGGTGAYTYNWVGGPNTALNAGIPANTYVVIVQDTNMCADTASVTILEPPLLASTITDSTNVSCFGGNDGTAQVTATGGAGTYSYLWNDAAATTIPDVSALLAGTYTVTVTDSNNCTTTSTITITQPLELLLTTSVDSNASCIAGSLDGGLTVGVSGGTSPFDYVWSNTQNTLGSPLTTNSVGGYGVGTHFVTVTDANGCITIDTATVVNREGPTVSNVTTTTAFCNDPTGTIDITASTPDPGLTYVWTDGLVGEDPVNVASGTYMVTVTDAAGCDTSFTVVVPEAGQPSIDSLDIKNAFCDREDGRIEVNISSGTLPYTYLWSHDSLLNDPTAFGLIPGVYNVTVIDAFGCDSVVSNINIDDIPAPVLEPNADSIQYIYRGQEIELSVTLISSPNGVDIEWDPFESIIGCSICDTVLAAPDETTTYLTIAIDTLTLCSDTAFTIVAVKDDNNIFIPNAITPNGDGFNDTWVIRELEIFPDNELVIVSRWGEEVFRAKSYANDWDGTNQNNGKELPEGTYYYILKLNDIDEAVTGPVTIVK